MQVWANFWFVAERRHIFRDLNIRFSLVMIVMKSSVVRRITCASLRKFLCAKF